MNFGSILNPHRQDSPYESSNQEKEESEENTIVDGNEESEEEEECEQEFKQITKIIKPVPTRPTRQSNLRSKVINSKILQDEEEFFISSPPSPSKSIHQTQPPDHQLILKRFPKKRLGLLG